MTGVTSGKVQLVSYGRSFGCKDGEIDDGIDLLIGRVLHETSMGSPSIEKGEIVRAFTGYAAAKTILRDRLQVRMADDLRLVSEDLWPSGRPLPRRQWEEMSRAIFSEGRAFLVLIGDGGSGKSTALVDWLTQRLRNDGPERPCVALRPPRSGHSSWVSDIVADWSDLPLGSRDRREEHLEQAIERLVVANPDLPKPILIFGLDGLDETTSMLTIYDAIRPVLEWFRREDQAARQMLRAPTASLIVTSRRLEEVEERYLIHADSGFPTAWTPKTVHFGDFTDEELCEAARGNGLHVANRFLMSTNTSGRPTEETIDDGLVSDSRDPADHRPIKLEVLAALRHPSMWRAFLALTPEVQERVLDGEPTAIDSLARGFTNWFCRRTRNRRQHLTADDILDALSEIARQVDSSSGPFQLEADWLAPARSILGRDRAWMLFNEAKSAGYIRVQARNAWSWRHSICPQYLRAWSSAR